MSRSREVYSNQKQIHENLRAVVEKHLNNEFLKPIAAHNQSAYSQALNAYDGRKLIFDSGCGTGRSSIILAKQNPDAFIVGIDKSAERLERNKVDQFEGALPVNLALARADHNDFLRLAERDGIKLWKHKLYYPNPWPKSEHLKRRWHGSPLFKTLLNLGGEIELRSNWKLYLDEFSAALSYCGHDHSLDPLNFSSESACHAGGAIKYVSDFEEKYHKSEQTLWQLRCQL